VDVHLVVAASVTQHEQLGVEQGHAADALARPRLVQHHHLCKVKAKFHYAETDTDFFAAKLRWVRAGPF